MAPYRKFQSTVHRSVVLLFCAFVISAAIPLLGANAQPVSCVGERARANLVGSVIMSGSALEEPDPAFQRERGDTGHPRSAKLAVADSRSQSRPLMAFPLRRARQFRVSFDNRTAFAVAPNSQGFVSDIMFVENLNPISYRILLLMHDALAFDRCGASAQAVSASGFFPFSFRRVRGPRPGDRLRVSFDLALLAEATANAVAEVLLSVRGRDFPFRAQNRRVVVVTTSMIESPDLPPFDDNSVLDPRIRFIAFTISASLAAMVGPATPTPTPAPTPTRTPKPTPR